MSADEVGARDRERPRAHAGPRTFNGAIPIECLRTYRQLLEDGHTEEAERYALELFAEARAESAPPAERGEDD